MHTIHDKSTKIKHKLNIFITACIEWRHLRTMETNRVKRRS